MRIMNDDMIFRFGQYLFEQEKSRATIEKYIRTLERFTVWLNERDVEKGTVILYKQELMKSHAPTGVNCILALLLQLMASTGIRESEIRYVTVEALERGCVCIDLKGKIRTILLPGKLCRKLKKYRVKQGIVQGPVFL